MTKKKFKPKPGQVDFSKARYAPVLNCVVRYRQKILLVKRSNKLNFYPEFWNGISGFLDDKKSLNQKVAEELKEELNIPKSKIVKIKLGQIFHQEAPEYSKTWIVHPVLVEVKTDKIKTDWEAESFIWTTFRQAKKMKLLPGFERVLTEAEKLVKNNT